MGQDRRAAEQGGQKNANVAKKKNEGGEKIGSWCSAPHMYSATDEETIGGENFGSGNTRSGPHYV